MCEAQVCPTYACMYNIHWQLKFTHNDHDAQRSFNFVLITVLSIHAASVLL